MSYTMEAEAAARAACFFERIGEHLVRQEQRASFAMYAFGILGDGERKSVEPIAARACEDEESCGRVHERLLHFLRLGSWSDRAVRREAMRYLVEALTARGESVTCWIFDDTGMLKQGKHSPGVQRQYTGSAGKITNCQLAVSLSIATATEQAPIDMELYLPESWTEDRSRRRRARIPDTIEFETKIELAIDMMKRAHEDFVPGETVLADSFYGRSHEFRDAARELGKDYAVEVDADTHVWVIDAKDRTRGTAVEARELAARLPKSAFRRVTWRDGSKRALSSRFAFRRVRAAYDDGTDPRARESVWLVIEWLDGEDKPTKFFLTTLRKRMSKKQIVRTLKERWKTERVYEDLKGELGFDHFEGRTFPGWHHHVSVVLCCYAFVVAEKVRAFSPSSGGSCRQRPVTLAA